MADRPLQHLLRHLRRIAAPAVGSVTDIDLLGRFADRRDEAAFEALVWRHGPLVYGVCRRVLGHTQDAEDAFQAAFLILARKAESVRHRAAVGPWLYRVAQRVALRARGRLKAAGPLPNDLAARALPNAAENSDLRRILGEEIGRLPARYRAAVVLRYLEGRTTIEAAIALGCPAGTVLSRLAWARKRLRSRLTARGTALPAALAAIGLGEAAGAVPARWVTAVVVAAGEFAAGSRTGRPALLAAEVLRAMLFARLRVGTVVVFGVLATGAGLLVPGKSPGRVDNAEKPDPPSVQVTVMRPIRRTTGETLDFQGRTVASGMVEVRSRITSQIERVAFQPGAKVKRGDLLFELDARTYQVEYERAEAEAQRAGSLWKRARTTLSRLENLKTAGATSEEELNAAKGAVDDAQAGMLVAKAGLERAKLELGATKITSPIDGQTGGTVLGVGNLTTPAATLVTVVAADPVYVEFNVDQHSVLALRKLLQHGDVTAKIGLAGENGFPRTGKITFVDNHIDQFTPNKSTVRVRTVLPNSGGDILPGMFAQVRLMIGEAREELLLPEAAVRNSEASEYVLIAGSNNTIEWRRVSAGPTSHSKRPVYAGIGSDDRIIVDHIAEMPPGAPIRFRDADQPK